MPEKDGNTRRRKITLKAAFLVGFVGLTSIAVGGVVLLGYRALYEATDEALENLAEVYVGEKVRVLERELDPIKAQGEWITQIINSGVIDLGNVKETDAFFRGALAATPDLTALVFVDRHMQKRFYARDSDIVLTEDVSSRPEFVEAVKEVNVQRYTFWGPPVYHDVQGEVLVNYRVPLFIDDVFEGAVFQVIAISHLGRKLADNNRPKLKPFVLYGRDRVLSPPITDPEIFVPSNEAPLPNLSGFPDPILAAIWAEENKKEPLKSGVELIERKVDGEEHVYLYKSIRDYTDKELLVGTYLVTDEVVGTWLQRRDDMKEFGIAAFVVAVGAAILIGRMIGRPVLVLTNAAEAVGSGNLDTVEKLPEAHIKEIDTAYVSFNKMVDGLRERKLVRSLLGTYVPEVVAEKLIKEGGALEPLSAQATILFSDLADFTSLTERMGPAQLVTMLNAYFTVLTDAIERHGGVITQYQGDAILAVFNAPVADPDHAGSAVRAAVEALEVTEGQEFEGQRLVTRLGVATGDIVAGSVGAGDRLTYTVHGDAVNLAARLEQMNKQFGTRVLVAEETVRRTEGFQFKEIGKTEVRGQQAAVTVYTIEQGEAAA